MPRCGALSLLQKTPHYRGDPAETAARLNAKFCVLVVVTRILLLIFAQSSFESISTFENNFESTSKEPLGMLPRQIGVERNGSISARGNSRHRIVGLRRGNARHRLKHVATRLPPAGPHTYIQCRNRRRHSNRSNRQRRREDTANDPNS